MNDTDSDNDDDDGRETARIWAGLISFYMHRIVKDTHRGADLDLAYTLHEATILQVTARIACWRAEQDFDELYNEVLAVLDNRITKKALRYFQKEREMRARFRKKRERGSAEGGNVLEFPRPGAKLKKRPPGSPDAWRG